MDVPERVWFDLAQALTVRVRKDLIYSLANLLLSCIVQYPDCLSVYRAMGGSPARPACMPQKAHFYPGEGLT